MSDGVSEMNREYSFYLRMCEEKNEEPYTMEMVEGWMNHLEALIYAGDG